MVRRHPLSLGIVGRRGKLLFNFCICSLWVISSFKLTSMVLKAISDSGRNENSQYTRSWSWRQRGTIKVHPSRCVHTEIVKLHAPPLIRSAPPTPLLPPCSYCPVQCCLPESQDPIPLPKPPSRRAICSIPSLGPDPAPIDLVGISVD